MNTARNIAFGYSTRCNIKCDHCVAAGEPLPVDKMAFPRAEAIIEEMARCRVQGVSFTAGEPFLFLKDILRLVQKCKKNGMYSRMVTNGFWAGTARQADQMAEELKEKYKQTAFQHLEAVSCTPEGKKHLIALANRLMGRKV